MEIPNRIPNQKFGCGLAISASRVGLVCSGYGMRWRFDRILADPTILLFILFKSGWSGRNEKTRIERKVKMGWRSAAHVLNQQTVCKNNMGKWQRHEH
jgi:hypothetical protein